MRSHQTPTVSVIIPTLNEAVHLPVLLQGLRCQEGVHLQLIVSDGGSADGTPAIADDAGAIVIKATRGRGAQMNAGACRTRGRYLLFLHADSQIDDPGLLRRAVTALEMAITVRNRHRIAGHFRLRFARSSERNPMAWRYLEEKTAFNRPYTINGDQGLLIQKRYFAELGGFDETLPFLEDQRLAEKIRTDGEWITLPGALLTSARRFETEGFQRRYLLMAIIMGLHYADLTDFFQRAPHVYRAQHESGRLQLTPFFGLIRQILQERGWRERLLIWLRVGRFVRENAWQIFYFADVALRPRLGSGRYPLLAFHDRVAQSLKNCRWCDALVAFLTYVWVMGVFRSWFRLSEDAPLEDPSRLSAP